MERNTETCFDSTYTSPIYLTFSTDFANPLRMDMVDGGGFFFELDEAIAILSYYALMLACERLQLHLDDEACTSIAYL